MPVSEVVKKADMGSVVSSVLKEVERQDGAHPGGYGSTRDGVRLGLASMEDELRESLEAWQEEKRKNGWPDTYSEVEQTVAVGMRLLRSMRPVS